MPDAVFNHRAKAEADPEHAWKRLQDPDTWATVAGVDSTSGHDHRNGLLQAFDFTTSIGGLSYRGRAMVERSRPQESMTMSITSNEVTGTISVTLTPAGEGTDVEVVMTMRPAGFLGSLVFPIVTGAVGSSFDESVERLAGSL